MVKFLMNRHLNNNPDEKDKKKSTRHSPDREYENQNFYFFIEYDVPEIEDGDQEIILTKSFSAYQNANFSGQGFLEIIHPALAIHQIRCSRNQISFGVVFELGHDHDIDSDYIPDFGKIVWKKNIDKYDEDMISSLISKSNPYKVKYGDFDQS
ncbi:MAG: hypothetical protein GY699_11400 [Desulfobacteraceae bacterium]|nr:hypothetical protein [Desulfobacteraceae bacterium]